MLSWLNKWLYVLLGRPGGVLRDSHSRQIQIWDTSSSRLDVWTEFSTLNPGLYRPATPADTSEGKQLLEVLDILRVILKWSPAQVCLSVYIPGHGKP